MILKLNMQFINFKLFYVFIQSIATSNDGNLITSPISAAIVLSMASFGAGGNTEKQMSSTLHLPGDNQISKNGYESLITTLNVSFKKIKYLFFFIMKTCLIIIFFTNQFRVLKKLI